MVRLALSILGSVVFDLYLYGESSLVTKSQSARRILNPDLLNVLPEKSSFLPYCHINLDEWKPKTKKIGLESLRIGHAPTHRGAKGTKYILNAIENLRNRGFRCYGIFSQIVY